MGDRKCWQAAALIAVPLVCAVSVAVGQPCDDGNDCTGDDMCVGTQCNGTPTDGASCTLDVDTIVNPQPASPSAAAAVATATTANAISHTLLLRMVPPMLLPPGRPDHDTWGAEVNQVPI